MVNLLVKEFRINPSALSFKKGKIVSTLLSALLFSFIIVISTYIYVLLFKKFKEYNASIAFSMVYMAILSVLTLVYTTFTARKIFFNQLDAQIMISRPVDILKIIVSKLVYLFSILFVAEFIILAPHYIAYGIMVKQMPFYYFVVLISVIFHTIFDIAIAMFLMVGYHYIYTFLKKHMVVQIIVVVSLMIALCFAYSVALNVFVNLLNNNAMNALFNDTSIMTLRRLANRLYPDILLSGSLFTYNFSRIWGYMMMALGLLIAGVLFVHFTYSHVIHFGGEFRVATKKRVYKEHGPIKASFIKELQLLTRNSDNLYSFTALIIIEPILTYLVVLGINTAFNQGMFAMYALILPNFLESINILIILLFSSLISLGGVNLLKTEARTIRIMKFIPVPLNEQIMIKMAILGIAVLFTNVISLILLVSFGLLSLRLFFFLLVITVLFNFALIVISFHSEIKNFKNPNNDNAFASILSIIVPILLAGINVLLGLATQLPKFLVNIIIFTLIAMLAAHAIHYLVHKLHHDVAQLEVIN